MDHTIELSQTLFYTKELRKASCLILMGANIHYQDDNGDTSLIHASRCGNLEVVKLLVEKGSNIYLKNKDGHIALTIASIHDHKEVFNYLLEKCYYIPDKNNYRKIILTLESQNRHLEIVRYLEENLDKKNELETLDNIKMPTITMHLPKGIKVNVEYI